MTKTKEKFKLYKKELKKYVNNVDEDLLDGILKYLGPSIFNKDAELVATNQEHEVNTLRESFLKSKLGLNDLDNDILNSYIHKIKDILGKSNRRKYRAIFYYLLVLEFDKRELFVDEIEDIYLPINVDKVLLEKRKNTFPNKLYIALIFDIILILIICYLLFL